MTRLATQAIVVLHTAMLLVFVFFFNDTATTEIYTLSLHDALPIFSLPAWNPAVLGGIGDDSASIDRSEEHTSELQSLRHRVCRLLLEKKKTQMSGWLDAKSTRLFCSFSNFYLRR